MEKTSLRPALTMPQEEMCSLADFFRILGDPTRVQLLLLLSQNGYCVSELAQSLNISQSAVSHHLRALKIKRLVVGRRVGKYVIYSLSDNHVSSIISQGWEHIQEPHLMTATLYLQISWGHLE